MLVKKLHETAGSIYHCCLMVFVLLIFLYSKIVLDNGNPGKKKKIRAVLHVSPDALRVVEDSTKALLLDQTIEKVSFCAPDRNYERAFSYICRDGTTRRWLCHSFFAVKESGERLSHAVGCAFAACLEKKQKREKESVTATFNQNRTTFTREGSFRVKTITEQQEELNKHDADSSDSAQVKVEVHNPSAVPRPHAPLHLIRQASLRTFGSKKSDENSLTSPFKRNYSLPARSNKHSLNVQQKPLMHPVPEVEEENLDISKMCSTISTTFASGSDDPFAKAPMLGSPLTPKPVNGFDKSAKPITLPALPLVPNQPQLAQSSPVRETNPWAQDARRQLPDQFGNSVTQANSQFGGSSGAPVHTHKRSASEADRWLNSVQMQAQNNAMTALQFQPQPFYNTTQAAKPSDPFQPQTNRPSGFVVNL